MKWCASEQPCKRRVNGPQRGPGALVVNNWAFAQCTEEIISHKDLFGSDSETDDEST